jgi:hypothetical protein
MREYGQGILIEELFNILESAVKNNQGDRLSTLVQYRVNNFALPSYSYPQYVPEIVGNIAYESVIQSRPRPKLVKFCNGFYSDADMLKYISAEVLPWALGEFYTGPEVEPLNGIMPLAERRLPPK